MALSSLGWGCPSRSANAPARSPLGCWTALGVLAALAGGTQLQLARIRESHVAPADADAGAADEGCRDLAAALVGEDAGVQECATRGESDVVVNNMCLERGADDFMQRAAAYQGERHNVGLITFDSRVDHPAHALWEAYSQHHGYTYLHLAPSPLPKRVMRMDLDFASLRHIVDLLEDPEFQHIHLFMYTELDQWPVRPLVPLEAIFEHTGILAGEAQVAVVREFPCAGYGGGGEFNMGNYLFKRSEEVMEMFRVWNASTAYTNAFLPKLQGVHVWPARQGAFSVDVYPRFRPMIAVLPSGRPLGSPFGDVIGHMVAGRVQGAYDWVAGQAALPALAQCALQRLRGGSPEPCAMYPLWANGTCLRCRASLEDLELPPPWPRRMDYTACCGATDGALVAEALRRDLPRLVAAGSEVGSLDFPLDTGRLYPTCAEYLHGARWDA